MLGKIFRPWPKSADKMMNRSIVNPKNWRINLIFFNRDSWRK